MKISSAIALLGFSLMFAGCSGGGGTSVTPLGIDPSGIIPDFNTIIDSNACHGSYDNPFGEENYYQEELGREISFGNGSCVKKILELSKLDVNQPISGYMGTPPTLPVWLALEDKVFFFSKVTHFEVIKVLVEAGAKLNIQNNQGENPLLYVLKHTDQEKYFSVGQYLIQTKQMNLDEPDQNGKVPIHYIVDQQNPTTLDVLLAQKPDLNIQSSQGTRPLFQAINNKWLAGTEKLLASGADIEVTDGNRNLPIHSAIRLGLNKPAIKMAGKLTPEKRNATNSNGQTPLWIALSTKNQEVATNLLSLKVNVNIGNKEAAPLHLALGWNNTEIRRILVERVSLESINDKDQNMDSGIHIATRNHDMASLTRLLQRGANPNAVNGRKQTALHIATANDFTDAMSEIIKANPEANTQDVDGNTPLHLAKNPKSAQILISVGANKDQINNDQKSPIVIATQDGNDGLFMYFVGIDANIDWVNADNANLLHVAADKNMPNAVNYLVAKKDVNAPTSEGKTALFFANSVTVLTSLINAGGKIEHEELKGKNTVFTFQVKRYLDTLSNETLAIVRELVKLKADTNHKVGPKKETVLFDATKLLAMDINSNPVQVKSYYADIYQVLLSSDIDVNSQNGDGETVLFYADSVEEIADLKRGSQSGAINTNLKDKQGRTAMDRLSNKINRITAKIADIDLRLTELDSQLELATANGETKKITSLQNEIKILNHDKTIARDELQRSELLLNAILS